MNDHLPECYQSEGKWGGGCICVSLRACEQRVLSLKPVGLGVLIAQRARERALDAAREAVRGIASDDLCCMCPTDEGLTLAAIDALKEKS